MRVCLTGAAGHLGSLILERCLAEPAVTGIRALDLAPVPLRHPRIEPVQANIRDAAAVVAGLAGCDAVIHTAFNVDKPGNAGAMLETNISGSRHVADACRAGGVAHLIYLSSGAVYGFGRRYPERFSEDDPLDPPGDFAYADQKCAVEEIVRSLEPEIAVTVFRPAICVGLRGKTAFAKSMRKRRLVTTSRAPLQILWDGDLADAVLLALRRGQGGVFNLGGDQPMTCAEMAAASGMRAVHLPPRLALAGVGAANAAARLGIGKGADSAWIRYLPAAPWLDAEKAQEELGWRPRLPTCGDIIRHFAATVPIDDAPGFARLVRALAAVPPPVWDGGARAVQITLLGPQGGDLTVEQDGRPARAGRAPAYDARLEVSLAALRDWLLAPSKRRLPRPEWCAGEMPRPAVRSLLRWLGALRQAARDGALRAALAAL